MLRFSSVLGLAFLTLSLSQAFAQSVSGVTINQSKAAPSSFSETEQSSSSTQAETYFPSENQDVTPPPTRAGADLTTH